VVEVDDAAFGKLADRLDDEHGVKVREGRVRFRDGEIATRAPRIGKVVDRAQADQALRAAFVSTNRATEIEVIEDAPVIGEEQIEAALTSFAEPAVSAPVTLNSGDVSLELDPVEYTPSLKMVNSGGALVPEVNSDKLASLIKRELAEDGGPQEATVRLVNGQPQVVADKVGVSFDQDEVDEVFLEIVAAEEGKRTAEVKSVEARSDFTSEDAKKLNIVERVSTFETRYPYAEYRNVNLSRAAELINGTVLKPGEVFSLNEIVGERTRANGFTTGIMIADGVFKEDLGGGVSQMATTVFNSMFFAGFEDVEHKPHSFYISRYPVGREATVAWGSVDLRFRNDTPHGVLVEAKVQKAGPGGQGVVQVSMWSTKVWDITTSTSGRYALTSPKTRTLSGPSCMPNSGYGGFDIDVKRYFAKPGSGKIEKTENFRTTYTPSDTVVCQ
jgi:vancomycin resistance protein YoaR